MLLPTKKPWASSRRAGAAAAPGQKPENPLAVTLRGLLSLSGCVPATASPMDFNSSSEVAAASLPTHQFPLQPNDREVVGVTLFLLFSP